MERVLVTGGGGFLGSHLVDRLVKDFEVVVLDNFSGRSSHNLVRHRDNNRLTLVKGSITSEEEILQAFEDIRTVFHFAAQPDVRVSNENPMHDFSVNMVGSMNVLEAMRKKDVTRIIFASSGGTVYGNPSVLPTPEHTALKPLSIYGAAKCAFEMYLSAYSEVYSLSSASLRFANIIGPRLTHGVIYDFYNKLKRDRTKLEVLGSGKQEKAFIYVTDAVDAALTLGKKMNYGHTPVNVSSGERLTVRRIAELVREELGLCSASIHYENDTKGWIGDVVLTDLDIGLLRSFGWRAEVPLEDGVKLYLKWLIKEFGPAIE